MTYDMKVCKHAKQVPHPHCKSCGDVWACGNEEAIQEGKFPEKFYGRILLNWCEKGCKHFEARDDED